MKQGICGDFIQAVFEKREIAGFSGCLTPRTSVIGEKDGSGDSSNKAWVFLFFPKNKKLAEDP